MDCPTTLSGTLPTGAVIRFFVSLWLLPEAAGGRLLGLSGRTSCQTGLKSTLDFSEPDSVRADCNDMMLRMPSFASIVVLVLNERNLLKSSRQMRCIQRALVARKCLCWVRTDNIRGPRRLPTRRSQ